MAKYLFFSINNVWAYHFETEMELMHELRKEGHEIFVLGCSGVLKSCSSNPFHTSIGCMKCVSRRKHGLLKIGLNKENFFTLKRYDTSSLPKKFNSEQDLRNFSIDGLMLGKWVVSMLMTDTREQIIDVHLYADRIESMLKTALIVAKNVADIVSKLRIDGVYLHNGRFFDYAPVVEVCKKLGIDFFIHVRAGALNKYLVTKNHLPHELEPAKKLMSTLWNECKNPEKHTQAAQWFLDVRNKTSNAIMGPVYTAAQNRGKLPYNWNFQMRNIVIFNGSLFEYAIFDDWRKSLGFKQNQTIRAIVEFFENDLSIHFYLRVHPHLSNANNLQMQEIREIASVGYKNLTVIWPEDSVDTYELMERAEKVIVFGSTTGVEAAFLNKAVILWGIAFYEDLGCVYRPQTYDELFPSIKKILPPLGTDKALPYGFWQLNLGKIFKNYHQTSLYDGLFQGEKIIYKITLLQKVRLKIENKLTKISSMISVK